MTVLEASAGFTASHMPVAEANHVAKPDVEEKGQDTPQVSGGEEASKILRWQERDNPRAGRYLPQGLGDLRVPFIETRLGSGKFWETPSIIVPLHLWTSEFPAGALSQC